MAARAIWKGVITFGQVRVPVKLYSAIEDRTVHFRLLHEKDHAPVKQAMVNPQTDARVEFQDTLRAYHTDEGDQVMLSPEELEELRPAKSRDIEVIEFYPPEAIDHRWYDRPYYLGPDGDAEQYAALTEALRDAAQEGLARWVMRNKEYIGALRLYQGYPMLMALRYAEQVVPVEELQAPRGKPLDKRELDMSRQLIGMLESEFDPSEYQDEYRERVLELIEQKQRGGRIKKPPKPKKKASDDLSKALEASLKGMKDGSQKRKGRAKASAG
ncbi:Ku protein [Marinobacter salicampi]|uniref:non-homologous end joining protein Ku n=1 Tax=Marinobacter salicampi TaxID=435907 RepID=UPI00140BCFC4|nr:Ku protein [Marinobacter salicampi]